MSGGGGRSPHTSELVPDTGGGGDDIAEPPRGLKKRSRLAKCRLSAEKHSDTSLRTDLGISTHHQSSSMNHSPYLPAHKLTKVLSTHTNQLSLQSFPSKFPLKGMWGWLGVDSVLVEC